MALKTFVLINNVNNLSDARYCAAMGVDVLGFVINPAFSDYVDPDKYKSIINWLAGVKIAADCSGMVTEEIKNAIFNYQADFIEIDNFLQIDELKYLNIQLILKINENSISAGVEDMLKACKNDVHYFLIDCNISSVAENFPVINQLSDKYPIILSFSDTAEEINEILSTTSISGICLKGGNEIKPGFKDYDELAEILEAIEVD